MLKELTQTTWVILVLTLLLIIQSFRLHKRAKQTCSSDPKTSQSLSHADGIEGLNYVEIKQCGTEEHGEDKIVLYVSRNCGWCTNLIKTLTQGGNVGGDYNGNKILQVVYILSKL